jgi:hypothetical protein
MVTTEPIQQRKEDKHLGANPTPTRKMRANHTSQLAYRIGKEEPVSICCLFMLYWLQNFKMCSETIKESTIPSEMGNKEESFQKL